MRLDAGPVLVRDFTRADAGRLFAIVHEPGIVRFMRDWSENAAAPEDFHGFIDWHQTQKDSTDIHLNKRYAIALAGSDELVGMVGMGLEETINEVEVAFFMSARHQGKGYAKAAVLALAAWCFAVSDIKYLVLTIDCANHASCRLAEACGFELYEKRTPIGHRQPNMESDSYFYYRRHRA
jgi:RimJ/RimL family protein N-acetyltransferase